MRLILLVFLWTSSVLFANPKAIHVHFDLNKTILMNDSASNKSHDVIIAELISTMPEFAMDWDGQGVSSYYRWACKKAKSQYPASDDTSKAAYRELRNAYLGKFFAMLEEKASAKGYAAAKELEATLRGRIEGLQASFKHFVATFMIASKQWPQIDTKILIRTFGSDASEIMPEFIELAKPHSIVSGKFSNHELTLGDKTYKRQDFADVLLAAEARFFAINDDYLHWQTHKFAAKAAKPMPIYDNILSLFFDDNIEAIHDSIEGSDIVSPYQVANNTPILPKDLLDKNVFIADPLAVMLEINYFIERFNKACHANGFPDLALPINEIGQISQN